MSRPLAAIVALLLIAAADGPPLPHASGQAAAPGPGCGGRFTAARNDTLYSIARRCQSSVAELVQENRLGQPPRLAAGQALAIPGFARAETPKPPEDGPPPPLPPRIVPPPRPMPPAPPRPAPPPRPDASVYTFQAGDTLYSLARWARVSVAALRAANPDIVPTDIDVGDPIRLPRGAARPEPMRLRERGRPASRPAVAPAPQPPPVALPPRGPSVRPVPPPPPPSSDEADKPKPDDEAGDAPDGDDEPDAMGM